MILSCFKRYVAKVGFSLRTHNETFLCIFLIFLNVLSCLGCSRLHLSTASVSTLYNRLSTSLHTCSETRCRGCQQQHTAEWWKAYETFCGIWRRSAETLSHCTIFPHQRDHLKQNTISLYTHYIHGTAEDSHR